MWPVPFLQFTIQQANPSFPWPGNLAYYLPSLGTNIQSLSQTLETDMNAAATKETSRTTGEHRDHAPPFIIGDGPDLPVPIIQLAHPALSIPARTRKP